MAVGRDNLETELFVVADLDRVWVELAVSPEDVPLVADGPDRVGRGSRDRGKARRAR